MIRRIDISRDTDLEQLWLLQHAAYRVEAGIIGFANIPPLSDTLASLRECGEIFFGEFADEELLGAVSYELTEDEAVICRMMVHPAHFRKGIASRLLEFLFANLDIDKIKVSTGSDNHPAIQLYTKYGFKEVGRREAAPRLFITQFLKSKPGVREG